MMLPQAADFCRPHMQLVGLAVPLDWPYDAAALRDVSAHGLACATQDERRTPGDKQPPSPWRGLFCVEARFCGTAGPELWSRDADDLRQALVESVVQAPCQFVLTARGELQPPQQWSAPLAERYGIVMWFTVLEANHAVFEVLRATVESVVRTCILRPPPLHPPWTIADLPQEELAQLEAAAQNDALPPGHFFDGTHYIDVNGHVSRTHPALEIHMAAFLHARNAEVEAKNAVLREASASPLFAAALAGMG